MYPSHTSDYKLQITIVLAIQGSAALNKALVAAAATDAPPLEPSKTIY